MITASSPTQRAEALAAAGRAGEGVALLTQAGARGDKDALFTLAIWRLTGQFMPRDLARSRDLFRRAAEAGSSDAGAVYTAFLANGTGGLADWRQALAWLERRASHDDGARAQLALLGAMALTPDGGPVRLPQGEQLSAAPRVMLVPALFTPAECTWLADLAAPMLEPSVVIDPRTGRQIRDPVRTSDVAAFPLAIENPAVRALNRRLAAATGTDVRQGEPLQILRYRPGQEYKPHSDALPGTDNQRIITALVYLNEGYEGGETRFVADDLAIRGRTGDALIFRNVTDTGEPDAAARHAGLPVRRGTKLIASRWIRARPLDLTR